MPCRDYYTDNYSRSYNNDVKKLKDRADMLARVACKAMDELVRQGKADFLLMQDDELRAWYEQHVEDDRKARAKAEAARAKKEAERLRREHRQKVREAALSKLTVEEREVLLGKNNNLLKDK